MDRLITIAKGTYPRSIFLVALLFTLTEAIQVHAQMVGGTILGTVADRSGGLVNQAKISINNLSNGTTRVVTTDAAGFYTAPNLLSGIYEVTATAPGLSADTRTEVTLAVGTQQILNFTLGVEAVNQSVQVTSEAYAVDLATSSI